MGFFVLWFVCAVVMSCTGAELTMAEDYLSARSNIFKRAVPTCTNGYEKVPGSTMCLQDSASYVAGTGGVSDADKDKIIKLHNDYRAGVSPTATNMMKMYWDDELAAIAGKWAKQCREGHEKNYGKSGKIPKYFTKPGQNVAYGYAGWTEALKGWHGEVSKFVYGRGGSGVGHYTQVVRDTSILVGCGYAECNTKYKKYYVCNYLTGQKDRKKPYTSGTSCGGCKTSCSGGKLCDCGKGVFCFNYGTMDINKCTCKCQPMWSGAQCLTPRCNKSDPSYCYPASDCGKYANWPSTCPHLCGLCPAK